MRHRRIAFALAWSCAAPLASAAVTLAPPFVDGMVLQRDRPVAIWGRADAGEAVSVAIAGQRAQTTAGADGRWRVTLGSLAASAAPAELVASGANGAPARVANVLVGEVWVCGGQSNMELPVRQSATSREAATMPADDGLRLFHEAKVTADAPRTDCDGRWEVADGQTTATFSAVGVAFGQALRRELGVPVGVIQCSWSGTPAEAWTSRAAIESTPALRTVIERTERMRSRVPDAQREWDAAQARWRAAVDAARAAGTKPPPSPRRPSVLQAEKYPFVLFDGMVAPIAGYGARGVVWYQGEANVHRPTEYRTLLPAMIGSWRGAWGDPALPFGIVQLPEFGKPSDAAVEDDDWPAQRESQAHVAQATPGVDYVVTLGLGDPNDIHPKRKREVGERLAAWALNRVYGRADVAWAGPRMRSAAFADGAARVAFDGAPLAIDGDALEGFAVAGADRTFVAAEARLDGAHAVVVRAASVPEPVAVRYAWKNAPRATLRDAAGLPASPFRTDDWPGPADRDD